MKWYSKYIPLLGIEFSKLPAETVRSIRESLRPTATNDNVEVSVVVIAYNEERNLAQCLWSLGENRSKYPFEIIVVNNRSTDATQEIIDSLGVKSFYEEIPGAGAARQRGLIEAKGKYYLCIDSDTLYPPKYIETMVGALKQEGTAAVYTLWNFIPDDKNGPFALMLYQWFRDIHKRLQSFKRPELGVGGAAFGFHTALGRQIGFRTDIKRGEDGSMALALKKYGKLRFISSDKARVMTSVRTLSREGSLLDIFWQRVTRSARGIKEYTHKKDEYKDLDSNKL